MLQLFYFDLSKCCFLLALLTVMWVVNINQRLPILVFMLNTSCVLWHLWIHVTYMHFENVSNHFQMPVFSFSSLFILWNKPSFLLCIPSVVIFLWWILTRITYMKQRTHSGRYFFLVSEAQIKFFISQYFFFPLPAMQGPQGLLMSMSSGKRMMNHVMQRLTTSVIGQCAVACVEDRNCQ